MAKGKNRFLVLTSLWLYSLYLFTGLVQNAVANQTNKLHRARGASGQFSAYADDPELPPVLCAYAERVKSQFLSILDLIDQWRDPIIFVIRREQQENTSDRRSTPHLKLFQTDHHLKYQIDCPHINTAIPDNLLSHIIESLLLEIANRDQPTYKSNLYQSATIPRWLVQGLSELIRDEMSSTDNVTQDIFTNEQIPLAQSFVNDDTTSSSTTRDEFLSESTKLFTNYLLSLSKGTEKLLRFIEELGSKKSQTHAFWIVYRSDFPNESFLEKDWTLFWVRSTTINVAENLSAAETSFQLREILDTKLVKYRGEKRDSVLFTCEFDKLWHYYEEHWLADVLQEKRLRLQALRILAHPRYLNCIDLYSEAIQWLQNSKLSRFRRSVKRATNMFASTEKRTSEITRYLDNFEKTLDHSKQGN